LAILGAKVDVMADGPDRIATYTFAVPGGNWSPTANGTYVVNIVGSQVADKDATVKFASANRAGAFQIAIGTNYIVDSNDSSIDGNYTAGQFTLPEAIALANLF